jgi:hypothetical protein
VKGDRGWEKGEGGRMERGGEKMRETGDKAKRKKGALVSISNILLTIKSPLIFLY